MSRAMPDEPDDNPVSHVAEADRFHRVGVPGVAELLDEAHERSSTDEGPLLRLIAHRPHDDVSVMELANPIHVPGIPRLEEGSHQLDVVLRHRPRSISPRSAAFHAKRIAASRPKHYPPPARRLGKVLSL